MVGDDRARQIARARGRGGLEGVLRRHDAALLDSARYRVQWRPVQTAAAPVLEGTWLFATAEGIPDSEIMAAVRGHGALFERLVLDRPCRDRAGVAARLREAGSLS